MFLGIWLCISFVLCIITCMETTFEAEHEKNIIKFSFYAQRHFWEAYTGVLNFAGKLIAVTVMTAFILPANLLLFLTIVLCRTGSAVWNGFMYLFAERNDE